LAKRGEREEQQKWHELLSSCVSSSLEGLSVIEICARKLRACSTPLRNFSSEVMKIRELEELIKKNEEEEDESMKGDENENSDSVDAAGSENKSNGEETKEATEDATLQKEKEDQPSSSANLTGKAEPTQATEEKNEKQDVNHQGDVPSTQSNIVEGETEENQNNPEDVVETKPAQPVKITKREMREKELKELLDKYSPQSIIGRKIIIHQVYFSFSYFYVKLKLLFQIRLLLREIPIIPELLAFSHWCHVKNDNSSLQNASSKWPVETSLPKYWYTYLQVGIYFLTHQKKGNFNDFIIRDMRKFV
jgi:hypothetical protein